MEIAMNMNTIFLGFNPKITSHSHQNVNIVIPKLNFRRNRINSSKIRARNFAGNLYSRSSDKSFPTISAVLSGAKDVEISSSEIEEEEEFSVENNDFEGFSVEIYDDTQPGELKISVEVYGNITQTIFDKVFDKMVADAQPIPGFRRVKGGKTPDIPKHILLEVLGRSKVLKQVIKKVINSTISEYVEKEGLKVTKDLRIEQSFEDLESTFEAGDTFNFDAVLKLQE